MNNLTMKDLADKYDRQPKPKVIQESQNEAFAKAHNRKREHEGEQMIKQAAREYDEMYYFEKMLEESV